MKTLFIECRKKIPLKLNMSSLNKLPGKTISLAATIQNIDFVSKVKSYLEKKHKKIILKKGAKYKAHVLGCNSSAFDKKADTLLLIADGKFHAINNAIQLQKPIYIFNPDSNNLEKITKQEITKHNQKNQAKLKKFLLTEQVGIIISTKQGQSFPRPYIYKIKNKIEKLDKKVYLFETDNVSIQELENFPDIKIWINTACFGLARDSEKILNLCDVLSVL